MIEFNGAPGEIKALVEPKELQRLLSNLVNNSVEAFAGPGTAVLIELPRAAASASRLAVLLDDDMLVYMNWKLAAKAAGVELKAYKTREDFAAGTGDLPKETPLYIDSDLGNDLKGEDIAKELHEKGFTAITMAAGHGSDKFSHLPWLKVTDKEPPF